MQGPDYERQDAIPLYVTLDGLLLMAMLQPQNL